MNSLLALFRRSAGSARCRWHAAVWLTTAALSVSTGLAQSPPPTQSARPPTLAELYSELNIVDTAISTSGRYLAAIVRREKDDVLMVVDLDTVERKVVQRIAFDEAGKGLLMKMTSVAWKTDDRLLVRLSITPEDPLNFFTVSTTRLSKLGDRMFAIELSTGKVVALLGENRGSALEGAFNLGAIASFLPKDPKHVLMVVDGFNGASLFKVNVETGRGDIVERPSESVAGWWLDVDGNPVVRITIGSGTVRFSRKDVEKKWRVFLKKRLREMRDQDDYVHVGPSDDPDRYYVLARPPGSDRIGLYLYDLKAEVFGAPLFENPDYDLTSAHVSRDGKAVLGYCYVAHVQVCESTDAKINAHMRGLRKYFEESANVNVFDQSEDGNTVLLYVEGPRDPPGFYYYEVDKKNIQPVGSLRKALDRTARPAASVVTWKARDGKDLHGYLTLPAGAPAGVKLPLIVHPHGGPEMRDHLTYHPWVQHFVARGYAVFQPNFRGSSGFGREFAESGYGEWGRNMQADIDEGVKTLVEQGTVDPSRLCIVGASYGGYAALAGVSLTPAQYRCAVSIAGISDLHDFIGWRKRNWGSDSEGYTYWLKAIGDPDKDEQRLREVSPLQLVSRIKAPVLLIHGVDDNIVPVAQSRAMKKALDRAGMKTELIEFEREGHSYWQAHNEMRALTAIDQFLWKHLGPGHGVDAPPVPTAAK